MDPKIIAVERMVTANLTQILTRAAQIDEIAWMFPLRQRLEKRRCESYAMARDDFILSVKYSIDDRTVRL